MKLALDTWCKILEWRCNWWIKCHGKMHLFCVHIRHPCRRLIYVPRCFGTPDATSNVHIGWILFVSLEW